MNATHTAQNNDAIQDALYLERVNVSYGKHHVIKDLSLSIPHGQTFGLMGLNGAGKTTLIKAILGLRDHDSGVIRINGLSRKDKKCKREVSYLPERFDPPSFLNGQEFLRFALSLYKKPYDQAEVDEAAKSIGLVPDVLNNRVSTYSKGMRQKLGLLGTILTGCRLLILDEPMSGLDPRARAQVKNMIQTVKSKDQTIFLSSHILADMQEICDTVGVIYNNRLVFTGTPQEMLDITKDQNLEQAFLSIIDEKVPELKEHYG